MLNHYLLSNVTSFNTGALWYNFYKPLGHFTITDFVAMLMQYTEATVAVLFRSFEMFLRNEILAILSWKHTKRCKHELQICNELFTWDGFIKLSKDKFMEMDKR